MTAFRADDKWRPKLGCQCCTGAVLISDSLGIAPSDLRRLPSTRHVAKRRNTAAVDVEVCPLKWPPHHRQQLCMAVPDLSLLPGRHKFSVMIGHKSVRRPVGWKSGN